MHWIGLVLGAVLAIATGSEPPAPPVEAEAPPAEAELVAFEGSFSFVGGQRERDGVDQAVERAVAALLPIFHELARKRIGRANSIPTSVSMSMDGDDLVIVYGDLQPMRAPPDGSVRHWHNREGTKVKLKIERRGTNQIVQTTWGGGGSRVMVWTLDQDGKRLRLHSTMSSPSLPVAVDYRLTFRP